MLGPEFLLANRRATTRLGRWIAQGLQASDLVVLSGDLGAGKTFLARSIVRGLGLDSSIRVTSPTFNLMNQFETVPPVIHADLYRIADAEEVDALGIRDARSAGAILLVEWGEAYLRELGGDAILLELRTSSNGRIAHLSGHGTSAQRMTSRAIPPTLPCSQRT